AGRAKTDRPLRGRAAEVAERRVVAFGGAQLVLDGERDPIEVGDGADVIGSHARRCELAREERDRQVGDPPHEGTQQAVLQCAELTARHGLRFGVIEVAGRSHGRSTILRLHAAASDGGSSNRVALDEHARLRTLRTWPEVCHTIPPEGYGSGRGPPPVARRLVRRGATWPRASSGSSSTGWARSPSTVPSGATLSTRCRATCSSTCCCAPAATSR